MFSFGGGCGRLFIAQKHPCAPFSEGFCGHPVCNGTAYGEAAGRGDLRFWFVGDVVRQRCAGSISGVTQGLLPFDTLPVIVDELIINRLFFAERACVGQGK